MRILHTADWHLGKKLNGVSRHDEQIEVLNEICIIAAESEADVVVIAGDLFDTFNPGTESVELFYQTLRRLSNNGHRPVIAIAGNHDSPDRVEAPDPLARACGIVLIGFPHSRVFPFEIETGVKLLQSDEGFIEFTLPNYSYPLRILVTPYANEARLKTYLGVDNEEGELRNLLEGHWTNLADKYCDDSGVNVLLTHLFMVKKGAPMPDEPDDEKSILHVGGAQAIHTLNIPFQMQYAALGHLHRFIEMDNSPCPVIYSSSPLCYSFAEAEQTKYVVLVNLEPGKPANYERKALKSGKPLLRRKFEDIDLAIEWLNIHQNCLLELTIVTENYLSSSDRKRLISCHPGIVTIIPELKGGIPRDESKLNINLNDDMNSLFSQYFEHRLGLPPDDAILELFNEIQSHNAAD